MRAHGGPEGRTLSVTDPAVAFIHVVNTGLRGGLLRGRPDQCHDESTAVRDQLAANDGAAQRDPEHPGVRGSERNLFDNRYGNHHRQYPIQFDMESWLVTDIDPIRVHGERNGDG